MNKAQLVESITAKTNFSKADATKTLDAFVESVTETLSNGESIQLVGFGTFGVSTRAARKGRNPQTGAEIQIAESKAVSFKSGKSLKEAVNG